MKTLALSICLCTTAIVATIIAAPATSTTTDETRIARLEKDVASLSSVVRCIHGAIPVTNYRRPNGTTYLAPTKRPTQKFMWVVVMTPGCLTNRPTGRLLGWRW